MKVSNIFLFTAGPEGSVPIPSVHGIYMKYACRDTTKFIGWFHLSSKKTAGKYVTTIQKVFTVGNGCSSLDLDAKSLDITTGFKNKDQIHEQGILKNITGDVGAIILAHGSSTQAGTLSPDALAYAINDFRNSMGLTQQFGKIVFDVCNVGVKAGVFNKNNSKYKDITFEENEEGSEEDELVQQDKLNFLQAFLSIYGPLSDDAGPVRVAGWDSGVSVYHPENEYATNKVVTADGYSANVSNFEIIKDLRPGQKFLSNREADGTHSIYTLGLINDETRRARKKMYNYVSTGGAGNTKRVVQLKIKDWSDKETLL